MQKSRRSFLRGSSLLIKPGGNYAGKRPDFANSGRQPFRAQISRLPIRVLQLVDAHAFFRRYVDEFPAADVNAAMRRAFFVGGEEYEIAFFQRAGLYALADFELLVGAARDLRVVLGEYVLDKARTVEPLRRRAAELIGNAGIFLGRGENRRNLLF